jgi:putative transcription factor
MSEEWENVTRIGQKHGGKGAGGGPRPVVVKGKTALNAAFRTGGVSTQKRTGTANSVGGPSMSKLNLLGGMYTNFITQKTNPEGQRERKIDEADGPMAVPKNDRTVADTVEFWMKRRNLTSTQLAQKISRKPGVIRDVLRPTGPKADPDVLRALERELGVQLLGKKNIGQLTKKGIDMEAEAEAKRKEEEAKEAAAAKKAEEAENSEEAEKSEEIEKSEEAEV